MKNISIAFIMLVSFLNSNAQKATQDDVLTKKVKGPVTTYISKDGQEFSVGDTITLGNSSGNLNFVFLQQNAGLSYEPLPNNAGGSQIVIKKMSARFKKLTITTTKPQGYVFALWVNNLEGALSSGEIKSNVMTSDEALEELKKYKSKLDLELITQEEYDAKKKELVKFIK